VRASWTRNAPYPPIPDIIGSTTPSTAATATVASKALPPARRISQPACVASGCAVLIMPAVPNAGRSAVLRLSAASAVAARRVRKTNAGKAMRRGRFMVQTISQPLR